MIGQELTVALRLMIWLKNIFSKDGRMKISAKHTATNDVLDSSVFSSNEKTPGSMTQVLQPAYTLRLRPATDGAAVPDAVISATAQVPVSWHGISHPGMVRPLNEDSFSCVSLGKWSLYVVADGMGGHDAGEIASRLAVETVCKEMENHTKKNEDLLKIVEDVVQRANLEVNKEGVQRGSNMGTTLALALVADDTAYVANVGDSRVYWMENGSIAQITRDHSLVAKLVDAGKLTKEEARNHPKSNLLYRTIGTDEHIKVDTFRVALNKGGNLMLCTDGLWNEVSDEDIYKLVSSEKDVRSASEELIRMANENGGRDNITAIVVKVT
jgi:serine/threonine protein phosphatase PrpC